MVWLYISFMRGGVLLEKHHRVIHWWYIGQCCGVWSKKGGERPTKLVVKFEAKIKEKHKTKHYWEKYQQYWLWNLKQKLKRGTKQNIIVRNINKIGWKKAEQKIPLGHKMSSNPKETIYLVFLMPVQRIKSYAIFF